MGGGGERILRLAARTADVVAVNVNLKAGVIDERAFPDGVPEATDRKLAWIRDAAGPRFDELELQVRVHLAMVTDDRAGTITELAPAFGLTPDAGRGDPPRAHRQRWSRSATSSSSAASAGASPTSASAATSSTPSRRSSPASPAPDGRTEAATGP